MPQFPKKISAITKVASLLSNNRQYVDKLDRIINYLDNHNLMLIQIIEILSTPQKNTYLSMEKGQIPTDLLLAQSGSIDGLTQSLNQLLEKENTQEGAINLLGGRLDNLDNASGNLSTMTSDLLLAQSGSIDGLTHSLNSLIESQQNDKDSESSNKQPDQIPTDLLLAQSGSIDGLTQSLNQLLEKENTQEGAINLLGGRLDNLDNASGNLSTMISDLLLAQSGSIDGLTHSLNSLIESQQNDKDSESSNKQPDQIPTDLLLAQSGSIDGLTQSLNQLLEKENQKEDSIRLFKGRLDNLDNVNENISKMISDFMQSQNTNEANYSQLLNQLIEKESAREQQPSNQTNNHEPLQLLAITAMSKRQELKEINIEKDSLQTAYTKAAKTKYEDELKKLENLLPSIFPIWFKLFKNGSKAYSENVKGNCSVWGGKYAEGFRNFCSINMRGRVLDIGSGPLGKPFYLQGYPTKYISAIEPLEVKIDSDIELIRGFNENLPWPNKSFNTIINSTSLDHVLSLEKALEETHRVMTDEGRFLVWIGSIPEAIPYDPKNPNLKPIDEYHLFHINESWFESYIGKWFTIEEKIAMPTESFTHIYYAFSKRN